MLAAPRGFEQNRVRAAALLKLGKPDQALSAAEQAIALRPDAATALEARGLTLVVLGRTQEAIADLRRALALNPDLRDGKTALARLSSHP